ncbi:MAG: hypothetical protein KF764_02905 [Labilithrix sp.]|nr:hypothetical protein [Labilithrix sp.]
MRASIGRPVSDWEHGNFVFFDEGELLGRAQSVSGLDDVVAAATAGRNVPDIAVSGVDDDLEGWLTQRARTPETGWQFVIRDNRRKRWVRLTGFVNGHQALSAAFTWAISKAELTDGPR